MFTLKSLWVYNGSWIFIILFLYINFVCDFDRAAQRNYCVLYYAMQTVRLWFWYFNYLVHKHGVTFCYSFFWVILMIYFLSSSLMILIFILHYFSQFNPLFLIVESIVLMCSVQFFYEYLINILLILCQSEKLLKIFSVGLNERLENHYILLTLSYTYDQYVRSMCERNKDRW